MCHRNPHYYPLIFISFLIHKGVEDINIKVLQMIQGEHIKVNCSFLFICMLPYTLSPSQYSVPVVKYDRNGFRPRLRQLIFTQEATYLVKEAKIKQRISYSSLKGQQRKSIRHCIMTWRMVNVDEFMRSGVSVSNLSDNFLILHVTCDDNKQKVGLYILIKEPSQWNLNFRKTGFAGVWTLILAQVMDQIWIFFFFFRVTWFCSVTICLRPWQSCLLLPTSRNPYKWCRAGTQAGDLSWVWKTD